MTSRSDAEPAYYDVFAADYALFFDDLEENMEAEGVWLDAVLRTVGARTVLDASCGTGRQALPLARLGYRVTATDPSKRMLDEARRGAKQMAVDITWRRCRFTELPRVVAATFDAVIALGNGLCHQQSAGEIRASLEAMLCCLRPGGVCLVGIKDFDTIRRERPRFHGRGVRDDDRGRTILFEMWDIEEPLLRVTAYTVHGSEGTWTTRSASTLEYMLGADELARLACEAGFWRIDTLDHPAESVYMLRADGGAI